MTLLRWPPDEETRGEVQSGKGGLEAVVRAGRWQQSVGRAESLEALLGRSGLGSEQVPYHPPAARRARENTFNAKLVQTGLPEGFP